MIAIKNSTETAIEAVRKKKMITSSREQMLEEAKTALKARLTGLNRLPRMVLIRCIQGVLARHPELIDFGSVWKNAQRRWTQTNRNLPKSCARQVRQVLATKSRARGAGDR
jgi:hypothetical protein